MIITIDGPAGSGKSTAARRLARALGVAFLDTGATYRAATLKAMREGVNLEDERALADAARRADIQLIQQADGTQVLLDGADVSAEIRTEDVSRQSFYAARSAVVREVLVTLQRRIGESLGSFVAEGRDQGSVVFPQADVKFYLDASPEVRARRRTDELLARGEQADYAMILDDIQKRDHRDRTRAVSPLVRPVGAIDVDTSSTTADEVLEKLLRHVHAGRQGGVR